MTLVSEQSARGYRKLHPHAVVYVLHIEQLALAFAHALKDDARLFIGHVHHKLFHRLVQNSVNALEKHFGSSDEKLVAVPPHRLD